MVADCALSGGTPNVNIRVRGEAIYDAHVGPFNDTRPSGETGPSGRTGTALIGPRLSLAHADEYMSNAGRLDDAHIDPCLQVDAGRLDDAAVDSCLHVDAHVASWLHVESLPIETNCDQKLDVNDGSGSRMDNATHHTSGAGMLANERIGISLDVDSMREVSLDVEKHGIGGEGKLDCYINKELVGEINQGTDNSKTMSGGVNADSVEVGTDDALKEGTPCMDGSKAPPECSQLFALDNIPITGRVS
ncbi:hypothetical protein SESBI_13354 [Sesbania bispinosa]|nr:hypothetical protein SESBI_13354 [Sesbania bispinosa]